MPDLTLVPEATPDPSLLKGQRWATLSELHETMPLAVGDRSFRLAPSTLGSARARGAAVPRSASACPADQAAWHLAASLSRLGGAPVEAGDLPGVVARISALPWSSVLHMLMVVAWRRQPNGHMERGVTCPHPGCGRVQDVRLDLGAMRVRTWDVLTELPQLEVELDDGLALPDGRRATVVTLEPAPWGALMGLGAGELSEEAELAAAWLGRGIVGVDAVDKRVQLPGAVIGGLSEADYSFLVEEHAVLSGGPLTVVEATCGRCRGRIPRVVRWTAAGFFGDSSPARRARTRLRTR